MTTIDLYRKHKAGEVSREKFLYEVRRDNNLPFITNLTSYDDAVKILKNKGIVTEGETKEAKADEAVKAEVKAKKPSEKKPDTLHIDYANPYEYRHGLQHELNELGEYTDEALEKAKTTVLKNLAKDANFYSNLLNAEKSSYTFKQTETDKPGMQAKADGHLKKEAKKDEKSNVKDNLGKKEEGSKKPKGVKIMPDKGVTGSEKTIKEGFKSGDKAMLDGEEVEITRVSDDGRVYVRRKEDSAILGKMPEKWVKPEDLKTVKEGIEGKFDDDDNTYTYDHLIKTDSPNKEQLKKVLDTIKKDKEELAKQGKKTKVVKGDTVPYLELDETVKEGSFIGGVDLGASFDKMKGDMSAEDEFEKLMNDYDWYAEFSDDPSKWSAQQSMEGTLRQLAKKIGVDKALEIYNRYAPSDRKVNSSHFVREDKHAKLKETLKAKVKEAISASELIQAKQKGQIIKIPKSSTQDIQAAERAKANYSTYE